MIKNIVGAFNSFVFREHQDGIIMSDCNGFITDADDIKELCKGLLEFAKKHKDDIDEYNIIRDLEFQRGLTGWYSEFCRQKSKDKEERKKKMKIGHVYLFECGGRYKIGFSKDVPSRKKQLDYRPFDINIITVTKKLENGYDIEQNLHTKYEKYKIKGEWYSFDEKTLNEVIDTLNNMR